MFSRSTEYVKQHINLVKNPHQQFSVYPDPQSKYQSERPLRNGERSPCSQGKVNCKIDRTLNFVYSPCKQPEALHERIFLLLGQSCS